MRDADERTVHCLEAIIRELHEMNKQLKIANQLKIIDNTPAHIMSDQMKEEFMKALETLDFA